MSWTFRASYINAVVAGDGWAVVAGRHTDRFPYPDVGAWDDLMVRVGDDTFALDGRRADHLRLADDDGRFALHADAGALSLRLDGRVLACAARDLGRPQSVRKLRQLPGMSWQPGFVTEVSGSIAIDGVAHAVDGGCGEIERGAMVGIASRGFAIAYDYHALIDPERASAHVGFRARALRLDAPGGRVVDHLGRRYGSLAVDIDHHGCRSTTPVEPGPDRVWVEREVDLGTAVLRRQLVGIGPSAGLHEDFEPT